MAFVYQTIWFVVIPPILAYLFFRFQKNRLKFKIIETTLSFDEITQIIEEVAAKLQWSEFYKDQYTYVGKTHPGFFSGSYGEQITVLLTGTKVYVNSIADPDSKGGLTFGRNAINENTLIERIEAKGKLQ